MAITSFPINTVLPTANIITNTPSGPVTATNVQAAINQLASLVGTGGGTPGGSNLQVQYNNSGSFGGYSNSQVTALLDTFSTSTTTKGVVPGSNGAAATNFLRADGTWAAPGGSGAPGGSSGQVQYNNSGSFGGYTGTQVTALLDQFTTALKGVVPASGSATGTKFLRDDNLWAVPPGGGSGTPGGSNLQVQYNNAGAFGGYTNTQVTALLDAFSTSTTTKGVVPGSNGVANTNFLRADGTWAIPPGGGSTSPGGTNGQVQFNNSSVFGGMSGTSWDDTNRALTITGAIVSTSKPIENYTQEWSAGAVTFTGLNYNFTDTASAVGTRFVAYQIGGADKFTVRKDGSVTTGIWAGTAIGATAGGTGQTFYVTGDILYASSVSAVSRLAGNVSATRKWLSQAGNGSVANAPAWNTILAADISGVLTGPSPTIEGAPVIWDNTTGTTLADGQSPVNALAYGADPTGAADSKTAIQAALNTNHLVYLPRGTYKLNSGLSVPQGGGLIGENPGVTVLLRNFTSGDTINIAGNIRYFRIENLTISRTGSAPISGYGINLASSGALSQSNDYFEIRNVTVELQFIGIHIGAINWGYLSDAVSQSNVSHGILIDGVPAQVQMNNVICASNGGDGFHCAAASANAPVGQWSGLSTFTNSGIGFSLAGYAAVRLSNSLFGNDVGSGVYINSGDGTHGHVLTNVYTEGSSGGAGFYFDSSMSPSASLYNCCAINNFSSGVINNSSKNVTVSGGSFIGNGTGAVGGNTFGILNLAGGKMTVSGVHAITSGAQTLGISNSGTICQVIGGQVSTSGTTNTATYS